MLVRDISDLFVRDHNHGHTSLFCESAVKLSTVSMDSSSSSKRVTRSQTLSVLGKRPARSLSRSSSITSLKNSNGLLTPDQSPDFKKSRTSSSTLEVDGSANKENIPPLRDLVVVEIPRTSRMVRRASTSSDISMASTRSRTSKFCFYSGPCLHRERVMSMTSYSVISID